MECVSQMWSIVPCLWDRSAEHVAYIRRLEQNMETLSTEIGRLRCVHQDVESRVEAEEAWHMRRTEEVKNWLERAHAMEEQVIELEPKVDQRVKKKCMGISCCPRNCRRNCGSSYKLGKEVINKLSATRALIEEGHDFDVVAYRLPPSAVDELPMETTVGLDAKFKEAWTCLEDKRVGVMGLYGTGGVGKTTLLKKINNQLGLYGSGGVGKTSLLKKINNQFHKTNNELDVVIWVVVSKPLDLGRVRQEIRVKLSIQDVQWNDKSEDLRAAEIFKVLKTKRFVLMLDDLWEPFELSKIGIPCPNESNMCKVVFTTRSEEVCRRMNAHPFIRVDCLPPHEALNLFHSKVGEETLKSHRDIPDLAKAVAAECGGLPLALITTGGAMAGRRNPQEWRHAITTLQSYPARFSDMEDRVLRILRYSYDSLENDTLKSCFLYCSLFPEDHDIDIEELISLWIGEGFLGESNNNVGEARAQGEYMINSLKRACLLEDGSEISSMLKSVRMHDVIRDMALWISDNKYVVQVGDTWTERNTIRRWNTAQQIALWYYSGNCLTEVPNCPNLITLFIRSTKLEELPSEFFKSMKMLRVMDLSENDWLKKLPYGIDCLINLEYLNVSGTNIYELPIEVQHLKNLKFLRVSCRKLSKKVIESLSTLQVFDNKSWCESALLEKEILEGLMCLENLKDLSMKIHHASNVGFLEESPKLQGCLRSLGLSRVEDLASFTITTTYDHLESLGIDGCKELEEVKIEVREEESWEMQSSNRYLSSFFSLKLRHLTIDRCPKIRNLTALIYAHNLQTLMVWHCESMEEIISVVWESETMEEITSEEEEESEVQNLDIFSSLTYLELWGLPRLRSICHHNLLFPSLEMIRVVYCSNLKKLPFDSDTANNTRLKKIQITAREETWWDNLVWESEATKQLFASSFKPY